MSLASDQRVKPYAYSRDNVFQQIASENCKFFPTNLSSSFCFFYTLHEAIRNSLVLGSLSASNDVQKRIVLHNTLNRYDKEQIVFM